jgi:RNA polymerase sigma-70 factor (ECF subfamily)
MKTDWEFLIEAKKGDDVSAEYIFSKYYQSLIRMTILITGSLDSAKDVVQETFVRIVQKRIKSKEGNFKSYLTTIAYRLALKEKYRNKKITNLSFISNKEFSPPPIDSFIKDESQKNIFNAIQSLADNKKEILVLRFYGKHSYEEISEITGIPIGTVKSRIYYAVKECGSLLKKQGLLE